MSTLLQKRYSFHAARFAAAATRAAYQRCLPAIVARNDRFSDVSVPLDYVAFSSSHDLPEQVASLRSFRTHVGRPRSTTIVSDGSHTQDDVAVLTALDPSLVVVRFDAFGPTTPPEHILRYAEAHPLGKKLLVMAGVKPGSVYVDADVLFFRGAALAADVFHGKDSWFLPDGPGGLDGRVVGHAPDAPANAGFFVLRHAPGWPEILRRLPEFRGPGDAYMEQSAVHLALSAVKARPLDADAFALHVRDHFRFQDPSVPGRTALRHYIGMVRYKFWLAVSGLSTVHPYSRHVHRP